MNRTTLYNLLVVVIASALLVAMSAALGAAEPPGKMAALAANLNAQRLATIPPSAATIRVSPTEAEQYEPIVVTLDASIPDGCRVYGNGWTYSAGVRAIQVSSIVQHVWARPGTHSIGYTGVWVHTKTIVIVDKEGNDQTIESLLGIGMIDSSAGFTVSGDAPGPQPDPDPQPGPEPEPETNPFPEPTQAWINDLRPIALSPLGRTNSKKLCDFFQGLKVRARAGGVRTSADIHAAIKEGIPGFESGKQPEYQAAMVAFFEWHIGRSVRKVSDIEYLFDALSWATWEASHE